MGRVSTHNLLQYYRPSFVSYLFIIFHVHIFVQLFLLLLIISYCFKQLKNILRILPHQKWGNISNPGEISGFYEYFK